MTSSIEWPAGKDFAFTIFDDPDWDSVENTAMMYRFLRELGFRTTKAVWPIKGNANPRIGGATCDDPEYLKLILDLKEGGFEIALHNVTHHTSSREQTAKGIEKFHQMFGHYPYSMANHSGCEESIYWKRARVSGVQRLIYDVLTWRLNSEGNVSQGHIESSPFFWGDLCGQKIKYVRNFIFGDINTLKACPVMPYHDPARPYVKYWFASTEGANADSFNAMISERNQERLVSERGASIMYTHFAKGFCLNGKINHRFKVLMERMASKNGWFVPASTLLDFISQVRGHHLITTSERNVLEWKWLWHKIMNVRGRS
jgi:hypothetical protein